MQRRMYPFNYLLSATHEALTQMQNPLHNFLFYANWNFATEPLLTYESANIVFDYFILLRGDPFQLLNGGDFLLLASEQG